MSLFRDDYQIRCEESARYDKPAIPIKNLVNNKEYTIKNKLAFICIKCGKKYSMNKQIENSNICINCGVENDN